jgi:hypothetical protein
MLSVVPRDSSLESLLHELACSTVVPFSENVAANSAPASDAQLHAFFTHALEGFRSFVPPPRNDLLFQREFMSQSLTARQCALFDTALDRERNCPP